YALAAGTPGFDGAVRIPNFNDAFVGAGPDVGAAEAGAPAMKFGLAAADATPTTPTTTPTPASSPDSNPASRPSGARRTIRTNATGYVETVTTYVPPASTPTLPSGSAPISLTMDSSSYTVNVGQGVTFTVRLIGNGAAPTGTVAFKAGGALISGCESIA